MDRDELPPCGYLTPSQQKRMDSELERARSLAGGWTALAKLVEETSGRHCTAQAAHRWSLNGVPPRRAVDIEEALKGAVLRQELRPDLYDDLITRGK